MALAVKHNWQDSGLPFWISVGILLGVALLLWRYTRTRILMDVQNIDSDLRGALRDKLLIALAVLSLALLFAVTHIRHIVMIF